MRRSITTVFALLFVFAVSLSGCGGGSDSVTTSGGKQVTSKGAIEKFGSITVNGVEYKTIGAKLFLPDDSALPRTISSETQIVDDRLLKLGMVVTVKGVLDDNGVSGTATEIEFRDNLKAKIDDNGVDLVNNTITVMGQKITLDDKIKPLLATLNPGDVVQISGLPDDKGGLRASFIEKKDAAEIAQLPEFEMKGFVSSVSGNTAVIKLDPAAATGVTVTFPAGTALAVGAFVEVKIPKNTIPAANGSFTTTVAPHIEDVNVDPLPSTPGVQVSIEGFASSGTVDSFVLNGQNVITNAQTLFVGGVKTDFALTRKIQAEGVITNGVLTAVKIEFKVVPLNNPGVSRGEIERLGSVVVNGIEFKTTGAVLHLPDDKISRVLQTETELLDDKLLKPGMVVTVKGGFDDNGLTGVAREIEFRNTMEARIDDKGVDFIMVMGQKVLVDDKIKSQLATLTIGDDVAISGMPDDKGGLRATFIEKKATGLGEFEAKGIVSNLSGNTFTLLLSSNATTGVVVTLGSGVAMPVGVTNGSFVEVRTITSAGVVTATKIELEDELEPAENERLELEGFVVSGTADDFFVEDLHVITTGTTIFVGGVKGDFSLGMKVEVEGKIAAGILTATKVKFKDNVRIDAIVSAVNGANTATTGDITLLGKKVVITSATQLKGLGSATLDLAGILVGQEVEIRGFVASNGTDIIATRVDLKDLTPNRDTFRPFLRGPITAMDSSGNTITIAGVTLTIGGSTSFRNNQDVSITRTAFFGALVLNNTVVKVNWNAPFTATTVAVREAELDT